MASKATLVFLIIALLAATVIFFIAGTILGVLADGVLGLQGDEAGPLMVLGALGGMILPTVAFVLGRKHANSRALSA